MATNAQWTVVFDDKLIIKNTGAEAGTGYKISDNDEIINKILLNLEKGIIADEHLMDTKLSD